MNPDSFVVVYSDNEGDTLAQQAAERLGNLRLRNVHYLQGGLAAWQEAGLEVVTSPNARLHTHGPSLDVRPVIVDRENAYGGVFKNTTLSVGGAGG